MFATAAGPQVIEQLLRKPRFGSISTQLGRFGQFVGRWWSSLTNIWQRAHNIGRGRPDFGPSGPMLAEDSQMPPNNDGQPRPKFGQHRPRLVESCKMSVNAGDNSTDPTVKQLAQIGRCGSNLGRISVSGASVRQLFGSCEARRNRRGIWGENAWRAPFPRVARLSLSFSASSREQVAREGVVSQCRSANRCAWTWRLPDHVEPRVLSTLGTRRTSRHRAPEPMMPVSLTDVRHRCDNEALRL